jgi:uncharacterized membrane protein YoaK (UPF0700 family)
MVDQVGAIIASVLAGIAGGFLSSWMAFNASGEKFDMRKHGNALITGALSGMGLGLGIVVSAPADQGLTAAQIAIGLFSIFLAAAGIDRLRSSGSHMITPSKTTSQIAEEKKKAASTTTTTDTTTKPS